MRVRFLTLSLTALALSASLTPAVTSAAPMVGDASSLSYFTGTWSCKTTKDANPKMMGQVATLTVTATKSWSKVKVPGGTVYVTRDVKLKKVAAVYLGDDGSYSVQRGPGWAGSTLAMSDMVNSGDDPLGVQTITKHSATAFRNNYTVKTPKGTIVSEMECTKK
jgi:hypothetical protein